MATEKKKPNQEVLKFGEKILKLRQEKNMSQMDVGALLGIDRENIRKYEKGLQEPRLTTIIKFTKAFEIDFNELLNFNEV